MRHAPTAEDSLLLAFLDRHPDARDQLPRHLARRLPPLARRIAPDLAEQGLEEDVVQRMWELLLSKEPDSFNPRFSGAMTYLAAVLRTAATDIRAEHTPPGERTRLYKRATRRERKTYARRLLADYGEDPDAMPWELVADPCDDIAALECRLHAVEILALAQRTAPYHALRALRMIARDGKRFNEAARDLHVSRFTLRRWLDQWSARHVDALRANLDEAKAELAESRARKERRAAERDRARARVLRTPSGQYRVMSTER